MIDFTIRPAGPDDESILWEMLYYAAHVDHEPGKTVMEIRQTPALAIYVQGWGRAGDVGTIAMHNGQAVGAAWLRLFPAGAKAYSKTDDETPELAIAVLPEYIGQGIGSALMEHLIAAAKTRYKSIALNVRGDNPAVRLYERLGFVVVGTMQNRAGTESYDMRLPLSHT